MESAADLSLLELLGEIVGNLTTSGDPSLNNDLMKKVKAICKKSDVYVKHVYHLVLTQLKKNHAEIRLSSFQIINELFLRSHTFREMLLIDFQIFLELTVETDYKQPLPPPKAAAKVLKEKAIEAIDSWHRKFGPHYKKLDLGYNYLKRVKNVEFNSHAARSQAERRQSEERERRKKNIINGQIIRVENEMSDMISEMELCATEIENCFKLLLPHPDDYEVHCADKSACSSSELEQMPNREDVTKSQDEREVTEDVREKEVIDSKMDSQITDVVCEKVEDERQLLSNHGLATRSYQLTIRLDKSGPEIEETVDNSIVLKTVCEFYKELTHKHLPMVNKWLSVLSKGEGMQLKIQQLIDLKRTLEASKSKFLELKITPLVDNVESVSMRGKADSSSDEDDDTEDFEDVPEKEWMQVAILPSERNEYGLQPLSTSQQSSSESSCDITMKESSFLKQFGADPQELGDPTSRATALSHVKDQLSKADSSSDIPNEKTNSLTDVKRQKLLEQAPVVPFDMDLYFWGDPNAEVHKMVKTYLDNNWASKEHEGEYLIGDQKSARPTRMVTFSGNFQPVKWSCRAPLPSGKLCPRRDRVKCPFHGKIVPRDETGTPINRAGVEGSSTSTCASDEPNQDSSATDWKEIQLEVEAATGLDLGGKSKQKRKSHTKASAKKEFKSPGLTDLKKEKNTARNRLGKIVLNKKAMRRVADQMDHIATKRYQEKFANQFNYSLKQ